MRLLVIDGNSIVNRAFYGVKALANKEGIFTNALYGFMNIYLKEAESVKPDAVAAAFDLKSPTFRHKADPAYKANRKGMPEELAMQMPYLKEMLTDLGIACVSCEGYEADDILGTLAAACERDGHECILMTGDRDSLQLVSERVTVHLVTNKGTIPYTPERFTEEYGFAPDSLRDLKALMGDNSDNIPGIRGIGEKTAMSLIREWHTIEEMYAHMEEVQATPRMREKLTDGKADAEHSKWLATIVRDVPIPDAPADYVPSPWQTEALRRLLTRLELHRLLERLKLTPLGETVPAAADAPVQPPAVTEQPFAPEALAQGRAAYTLRDGVLRVCRGQSVYVTQDPAQILDFLESDAEKLTDDAKPHYRYALANGRKLRGVVFDAAVCGYLLEPSGKDYSVAAVCAGLSVPYYETLGENADVVSLPALAQRGIAQLTELGMHKLWEEGELPLTRVLASMEDVGMRTLPDGIRAFGASLDARITALEEEIYAQAGTRFNIASPRQLGTVLFETLGLPPKKKTKSGYSTSAEVLEELVDTHPIIAPVLEYRQYTKLRSTYVEGLLSCIGEDGRIHTNFRQTETRTGRLSSTEPNLQNIPVRTELGRQMRTFFAAGDGCVLLDADYSQIELRLMAHLSGDTAMQEAFRSGADIHTATAARIFDMPEDFVTPEMRSAAKAVNFGILYGMGAFSLSKDIHVSLASAKQYIADYLGSFPKVSEFLDRIVADAIRDGYVCTMLGRRRYVPELAARNKVVQAAGRRIAMNTPVQGSAADLIKLAMVHVHDRLAQEVPEARLLMQVHDELIVEVPEACKERAAGILREEMEQVADLSVPLTVEVGCGRTWYDAKR